MAADRICLIGVLSEIALDRSALIILPRDTACNLICQLLQRGTHAVRAKISGTIRSFSGFLILIPGQNTAELHAIQFHKVTASVFVGQGFIQLCSFSLSDESGQIRTAVVDIEIAGSKPISLFVHGIILRIAVINEECIHRRNLIRGIEIGVFHLHF